MKRMFATILLLLISCSPIATKIPTDNPVFANSGCTLPCWYGIQIGSTTKQELLDILSTILIVNQDSVTVTQSINSIFDERIYFTMGKGPKRLALDNGDTVSQDYLWSGDIAILNGKAVQIILNGDLGITFQQLIDIFGEPDYVIPSYTPGWHIWVEAINPSKGLDFGYRAGDLHSELAPDTPVDQIKLFDAKLYDDMVQNKMFFYLLSGSANIEEYGWKGYGSIDTYWHAK